MTRPRLIVEGKDDFHSIIHLMKHYGVDFDDKSPSNRSPILDDGAGEIGGIVRILDEMETEIKGANDSIVGFVVDADDSLTARWQSMHQHIVNVGGNPPKHPEPAGYIEEIATLRSRVGIWVMPDNSREGMLEDFLRDLVAANDSLIDHANQSTDQAMQKGATFSNIHRSKAVIHAWLAWQESPGKPFGQAVAAKYLQPDRPAGRAFASWFLKLFQLEVPESLSGSQVG